MILNKLEQQIEKDFIDYYSDSNYDKLFYSQYVDNNKNKFNYTGQNVRELELKKELNRLKNFR